MYIRKQPSGNTDITADQSQRGRGNYEISGDFDSVPPIKAADLAGRQLFFTFGRYGSKATGTELRLTSGKKRLRRIDRAYIHAARQVQAALLFPKSRRDEYGLLGGRPTIRLEQYIVQHMHFKGLRLRPNAADIELGNLDLFNGTQADAVDFSSRMREVEYFHDKADQLPSIIRDLLNEHHVILQSAGPIPKRAEEIVVALMIEAEKAAPDYNVDYVFGVDVMQPLREILNQPFVDEPIPIVSIPPEDVEIRLREVAHWRHYAARGPAAAAFRREVRHAYNSTCIVCGLRLHSSTHCRIPGVDAAHILPWATYDLDIVGNGLCLCKLHHWAFDQQLISVVYEDRQYRVKITARAHNALDPAAYSVLQSVAGPVPTIRLPPNPQHWPRPQFLDELYKVFWT